MIKIRHDYEFDCITTQLEKDLKLRFGFFIKLDNQIKFNEESLNEFSITLSLIKKDNEFVFTKIDYNILLNECSHLLKTLIHKDEDKFLIADYQTPIFKYSLKSIDKIEELQNLNVCRISPVLILVQY